MNTPAALLFEHEDGRYAVNPDTTGDPKWHRLGPVDVSALAPAAIRADALIDELICAALDVPVLRAKVLKAATDLRAALASAAKPPADERAAFDRYWLDRQRARGFGAALSDDEMLRNPERRNDELHAWQARATLGVAQPPAGYVLVPAVPTEEMLKAGYDAYGVAGCYGAMIAAAPKAEPAQQPTPREPLKFSQRKALAICTESQKVSVSEVQRKMQISYAAAQELCQSLVDYGGLVDGFALSPSLKPAHKEQPDE